MRYYSTRQVALILGGDVPLAQVTVQKMCERGVFPNALRKGRVWLIPQSDLTPELCARYAGGKRPRGGRPRTEPGHPLRDPFDTSARRLGRLEWREPTLERAGHPDAYIVRALHVDGEAMGALVTSSADDWLDMQVWTGTEWQIVQSRAWGRLTLPEAQALLVQALVERLAPVQSP